MHLKAGFRHVLVLYNVKQLSRESTVLGKTLSLKGKIVIVWHNVVLEMGTLQKCVNHLSITSHIFTHSASLLSFLPSSPPG